MKEVFNHVLSLLVFGFFIFTAISSIGLTNPVPSCDELKAKHRDLGYYSCFPLIPTITRQNEFVFKVLAKETGKPIPHVKVRIAASCNYLEEVEVVDCDACFGTLEVIHYDEISVFFTDSNGELNGITREMKYVDKRDVQVMSFHFTDSEDKYVEKFESLSFDYQTEKLEKTIYLLDPSEL
jgi:hypothetical protein